MDRRRLLVSGGAAAVAATIVAVVGRGTPALGDGAPVSTADHARLVLDQVNLDLGLVNPTGLQGQFEQSFAASQTFFAQRDPDQPITNDLDGWLRQRMLDLCGTDSYAVAVTEVPETRTLLAFSFLACSQNQDGSLPTQIDPGMPVPSVAQNLEPDFFPVLLGQINDKSNASPDFADALQASSAALDQIIADNLPSDPGDGGPLQGTPNGAEDTGRYIYGVVGFILFLYWISGRRCSSR
jgi:hypothetical protein